MANAQPTPTMSTDQLSSTDQSILSNLGERLQGVAPDCEELLRFYFKFLSPFGRQVGTHMALSAGCNPSSEFPTPDGRAQQAGGVLLARFGIEPVAMPRSGVKRRK